MGVLHFKFEPALLSEKLKEAGSERFATATELDALLPAVLDRAFKGGL
jgi:hypothetical protein